MTRKLFVAFLAGVVLAAPIEWVVGPILFLVGVITGRFLPH